MTSWLLPHPSEVLKERHAPPSPIQPLQKMQSTLERVFRELASLGPPPGWRGSVKLLVSHINNIKSMGINPRLSVTWNTSYANNKLKVTKMTKCETRFKDLAAILSSLLFRQNVSKAFGNYWEVLWNGSRFHGWQWKAEQGAYLGDKNEQKENCHQLQEKADLTSSKKTLLPLQVPPAPSSSRKSHFRGRREGIWKGEERRARGP